MKNEVVQFSKNYTPVAETLNYKMERELVIGEWASICLSHPLPNHLFPHQIDAMVLLKKGQHVLLGKLKNKVLILTLMYRFSCSYWSGENFATAGSYPHDGR